MDWLYDCYSRVHASTARIIVSVAIATLTQSSVAATTAPATVMQAAQAGKPQDLIVLFDTATVAQSVLSMKATVGTDIDTPKVLTFKADQYRSIKSRAFQALGKKGIKKQRDYSHLPMAVVSIDNLAALQELENNIDVIAVYKNTQHQHTLIQSLPLISQPAAQSAGKMGVGTTVAVLDTGVNYTLSAFGSCSSPGVPSGCRVPFVQDFAPNDNLLDANGHGTNVAAIAAAVAPDTSIAALDVFNGNFAYATDIIAAINWSIANRAAYNIVAMNLSLGDSSNNAGECSGSWATTPFANARAAGILPIVASGNDGYTNGLSGPACAPGAVRVGAVYDSNMGAIAWLACTDSTTAADRVTCFSNSAATLTLLAPGSVISAGGFNFSGTSQATPHVAGAVAVLRAANAYPGDSLDQTVTRMQNTGDPVTDPKNGRVTPRLNLGHAIIGGGLGWLPPVLDLILN